MGLLLDIVSNHMHVGGDNDWWQDVLEHGEASPYAEFFDIDWHPVKTGLHHKLLLPVLGDHYGNVLDRGELRLELDAHEGMLCVRYFCERFPLDPRTYGQLISLGLPELQRESGADSDTATAIAVLAEAFGSLPTHYAAGTDSRRDAAAACKRQLAALCRRDGRAHRFFKSTVERVNDVSRHRDAGLLHRLLESQPYRLAYRRVAADEINYRRFFDINDLACVRMDNPEAFDATLLLVRQLVAAGSVDGLRIDHVDGLSDPRGYCERLQRVLAEALAIPVALHGSACYLVVEKILASHERMPDDWPIAGTTGYEVAQLLNGLFVDPRSETALSRQYRRFTGRRQTIDEIVYDCKKSMIFHSLSSELTLLANLLNEIAQADPHTRDFTYHGLREALAELVARFPVYRTYVTDRKTSDQDRHYLHWAITQLKQHSLAVDTQVFDFIAGLLVAGSSGRPKPGRGAQIARFVARFQQYTAPGTAKAVEDTACYVYNRLMALNEVGSSPAHYGVSPQTFHSAIRQRQEAWPDAMVSTSTHDAKRSEDVRTRIDVLSEIPDEWRRHLARWSRLNRAKKAPVGGQPAPSRNDEYLIYQTLIGVWPQQEEELDGLEERLQSYLRKAVKEAKMHTSWVNPDEAYEEAVSHFITYLLRNPPRNAFLTDFVPFQPQVAHYGMLNGLSRTLLKLGLPGVPDLYQGNEVWTFSLVDPDNRRPVDFVARMVILEELEVRCSGRDVRAELLEEMLDNIPDGRAKLYLTWRALDLRRRMAAFFRDADYIGLQADGARDRHVVAYARQHNGRNVVYAAARWYRGIAVDRAARPCGAIWDGTWLAPSGDQGTRTFRDLLSGVTMVSRPRAGRAAISAADLFAHWSVALLVEQPP